MVGRSFNNGNFKVWDPETTRTVTVRRFTVVPPTTILLQKVNSIADKDAKGESEPLIRLTSRESLAPAIRENYDDLSESEDSFASSDESSSDDSEVKSDSESDSGQERDPEQGEDVDAVDLPRDDHEDLEDPSPGDNVAVPEAAATQPTGRYPLRENRGLGHLPRVMMAIVFTQLTVKTALETYKDAAKAAITAELNKMLELKVFEAVTSPVLTVPIPSSMFIKVKYKADGNFDKIKARFVAGGHKQEWDFDENCSSPTASWDTALAFLATVTQNDLHMAIADVPSAYLHASRGTLSTIHMTISSDIANILVELKPEWKGLQRNNGSLIVRLHKAMYGLKESGLLWYEHLRSHFSRLSLHPVPQDDCVFTLHLNGELKAAVLIYVDDIVVASKERGHAVKILDELEAAYGCLARQDGPTYSFLGTSITKHPVNRTLSVTCEGFINKLCEQTGPVQSFDTPHPSNFTVKCTEGKPSKPWEDNTRYRSVVMSLLYVAKRVRPDILFTVSYLTTKLVNPTHLDMKIAMRVVGYLKSTISKGLMFYGDAEHSIRTHADAAFNVHDDSKSHSGMVCIMAGGPVFFASSKQKLVTKSSTEAELVAFDTALDRSLWLSELAHQIGYDHGPPLVIHQDNTSAITIIKRGKMKKKRGMIGVRFEFILEKLKEGLIELEHVSTDEMLADILTKPLHGENFALASSRLLG